MIKLLPPTGFARLSTRKDAARIARSKAAEGCTVTIRQESDGRYRVSFWPRNDTKYDPTAQQREIARSSNEGY